MACVFVMHTFDFCYYAIMRNIFLNLIAQYCVMVDLKKAILKNFKYVFVNLGGTLGTSLTN